MKTTVLTAYDEAYAPLADITVPLMRAYAKRHGLEFACMRNATLRVPFGIHWFSIIDTLVELQTSYDRVIALDVDQLITNPDCDFADIPAHGFHASLDWGNDAVNPYDFSLCGTIWHADSMPILEETLKLEPAWRDQPFPAQGPLRHVVAQMCADFGVAIHPRRVFNAVPNWIAPGNVPEPWQPGDFAAHLTMLPVAHRVALAQKLIN